MIFQKGDVIATVDKTDIRVITEVTKEHYCFINLKAARQGNVDISKGSEGAQPKQIVERHFAILEL